MPGVDPADDAAPTGLSLDPPVVLDEAVYVVMTSGRYDLIVEALSVDDYVDMVDRIRVLDGVSAVEASTYLATVKQTYDWGVG
ncbi:MAG: hypothetical protein GY745_23875 [Actinomycetia bacterium]|nr:hypothetical protein [Actinomycetes bacterium]